jgi:pyrroline-5-carboxylate reductase
MSEKSIGFIGGGRIVSIFLGGWTRADRLPGKVVVYDCNQEVLANMKARYPQVETTGEIGEAAGQDMVFLAVHPPVIKDVLPQVKQHLKSAAVLVSLAPKFTIAKLSEMLGGFGRIARMIPNAPSVVGEGYNPLVFGQAITPAGRDEMKKILAPLGGCPEVPEQHLETYAIVSAMGLTFLWPQLYELKALAESSGISTTAALEGLEKMLVGAVATMRESGLSPEQVQDLIPVKPLADEVAVFVQAARPKLAGLLEKLRP